MTILLVDDDPVTARLFQLGLQRERFAVAHVSSVAEAVDWLNRNHASVVVTDMNLGNGPTGLDLVAELRADLRWRRTPVIMVTGVAERGLIEDAARLGIRQFLVKPVKPAVLIERVQVAISESPLMHDELAEMGRLGLWERDKRLLLETSQGFLSRLVDDMYQAIDSDDHEAALEVARRLREPAMLLGATRCLAAVDDLGTAPTDTARLAGELRVAYELQGLRDAVSRALGPHVI